MPSIVGELKEVVRGSQETLLEVFDVLGGRIDSFG
jgi:hypothetical protein